MPDVVLGTETPKKRGRPPKGPDVVETGTGRKVKHPVKTYTIAIDKDLRKLPKIYKCTCCGKMTMSAVTRFYRNQAMDAFKGNEGYTYLCTECTQELLDSYKSEYGDEKLATFLTCVVTGHYFNEMLYETMVASGESVSFGKYLRQLNIPQWGHGKSILTNFLELYDKRRLFLSTAEVQDKLEGNWKREDRRNMATCIRMLGYDPFSDDVYTTNDRKFLFNTLSRYLTDETLLDDPHKLVSVIEIVKMQLQVTILQTRTVSMLRAAAPDQNTYKSLTDTLSKLSASITNTAKANRITADSKNAKAAKTLTGTIDAMIKNGVVEAKANVADVKMDEAYRHICELSHKALMDELNFTSDEYAKMVAEQSDRIQSQNQKITELKEELRKARVELDTLKHPGQYHRTPFENNEVYIELGDDDMTVEPDVQILLGKAVGAGESVNNDAI